MSTLVATPVQGTPAKGAPAEISPVSSVAGGRVRSGRWLARGLVAAGALMIPWLFVLAAQLPPAAHAAHWSAAWVGLDGLEALGLFGTGSLLAKRDDRYRLAAMATATLLVTDAWFDVMTAAPGRAQLIAIAMAICPELPVAALCAALALRATPMVPGPPKPPARPTQQHLP